MRYETWKKMNKEQKEEYIWHFGQPTERPKYSFSFLDIINAFARFMLMIFFFGIFVIMAQDYISASLFHSFIKMITSIINILHPIIVITLVFAIIERIFFVVDYYIFLKRIKR
jgi:hypothetical protein